MYLRGKFRNDSRGIGGTFHCNNSKGTKDNNRGNICKSKDCLVQFLPKPRSKPSKKTVHKKGPKKIKTKDKLIMNNFLKTYEMSHYARFIMD